MEKNLKPIGTLFADSWRLYKKHMNVLALISVIPFIFIGVKMSLAPYLYDIWGQPVSLAAFGIIAVFSLLYLAFIVILPFAMSVAIHEADQDKTPNIEAVYKRAFSSVIPYLVVLLLTAIITFGGLTLFIIPGIIASIYLSLALYVYIFENKSGIDALITSAWYVRNFWWDILARKIVLAILLLLAIFVFSIIFVPIMLAIGFGPEVFAFLLNLFVFMFIIPFSLIVYYLIYKDVKHVQHARGRTSTPEKAFTSETEKMYIILIIVAAVAAVAFFTIVNMQPDFNSVSHYGMMYQYHQY